MIPGNHELSLDAAYWASEGGSAADAASSRALVSRDPGSYASSLGIHVLDEGTHDFVLASGASLRVYASPYTPENGFSAFQYPSKEDRYNPKDDRAPEHSRNVASAESVIPGYEEEERRVDVVMTHGPMRYVLDDTGRGSGGCEHLRRAIARAKPKLMCFGHVHPGWGAERVKYEDSKEDPIVSVAKEWVGKNQAKLKGYAALPPTSAEDWKDSWKDGRIGQTLCVNAAIVDDTGGPGNWPWLVDMDLQVREVENK